VLRQRIVFDWIAFDYFSWKQLICLIMAKGGKSIISKVSDNDATLSAIYFDKKMSELQSTITALATKEDITALKDLIQKQKDIIQKLESKVDMLENKVSSLMTASEETEQYSRRLCLRINGIPLPPNEDEETAEEVRQKVKRVITECGLSIPDEVIDRAHRIGKGRVIAGKRCRQVIVRFSTFRHRTMLYQARIRTKNHRIYLDLTKHRKQVLDEINTTIASKEIPDCYAFADVNCHLCVKLGSQFHFIGTHQDFLGLLSDSNQ
jgi:uncharacterized coiled-coil protein SlyX